MATHGSNIVRKQILVIAALMLAGCATPDQVVQKQIAFYTPPCKKLGYETETEINNCVLRKINENQYFWAATQDISTESGSIYSFVPVPPQPPPQKP